MKIYKILPILGLSLLFSFAVHGYDLDLSTQLSSDSLVLNFRQLTLLAPEQREEYFNEITLAAKKEGSSLETPFVSWDSKGGRRMCFDGIFGADVPIDNPDSPAVASCMKNKKNPQPFFRNPNNSLRWNRFIVKLNLACMSADCKQIQAATEKKGDSQWLVK